MKSRQRNRKVFIFLFFSGRCSFSCLEIVVLVFFPPTCTERRIAALRVKQRHRLAWTSEIVHARLASRVRCVNCRAAVLPLRSQQVG